jgi:hypothetical protein
VRRVWTGIAAVAGFVLGSVATLFIGIGLTVGSECDGPCFDQWDDVVVAAVVVGVLVGVLAAFAVRSLLAQR